MTLLDLLIKYHSSLSSRDFIIDYFVDSEYMTEEEAIRSRMIKPGKLFTKDNELCVVTEALSKKEIGKYETLPFPEKKLSFYTRIKLNKGMIENHNGDEIETTLGVYLLNYITLVKPFGSVIPYINGYWKLSDVEAIITKKCIDGEITPSQVYRYVDYAYFLSSLNDFCVCGVTERSITSNPLVDQKRDELFEKYKDQLDDPNVMVTIEDELINLDKKLLADDPSSGFLIKGKNFNVQRKRMFMTLGLVETFGDDVKGYEFGSFNLNKGWDLKQMDIISNDIRRGSYNRAKSTALGGYESKVLGRNFQDSTIVDDDCGSKRGLKVLLNQYNIKQFYYRNLIINNELVELNENNAWDYVDKEVEIRSPMYCNSINGYCYTCMDNRFKKLNIKLFGVSTIAIGSIFVTMSLKAVHGTKVDMYEMKDLNDLLI